MKRVSNSGFTIVESLIVLGISGVLFASLVVMVSGQQSKARFKSAMTDIKTQIQQNINEVSSGFYPNNADFSCQSIGGNVNLTFSAVGGNEQGTNEQCIFLGRALMFGVPGTDPEQYKVQTLIGIRTQTNGREVTTLRDAGTRAVAPGVAFNPSWQDRSETRALQYGTKVGWIRRGNNAQIAGFAIVTSPQQQTTYGTSGSLDSGSIVTSIIPIRKATSGGTPGVSGSDGVDLIARSLGIPESNPQALPASAEDGPVRICFMSGINQSGLVTIGANDSVTGVEMEIHGGDNCGYPVFSAT